MFIVIPVRVRCTNLSTYNIISCDVRGLDVLTRKIINLIELDL